MDDMEDNERTIQLNIAMCYNHFQHQSPVLIVAEDERSAKEGLEAGEGQQPAAPAEESLLASSGNPSTGGLHQMDAHGIPESTEIETALTPKSNPSTDSQTLQESAVSLASTTNTDICVLETHYGRDERHHEYLDSDLEQHTNHYMDDDKDQKPEEFTMIQKTPEMLHSQMMLERRNQCKFDESTEVLMLVNSDYPDVIRKSTYSTTDSDVEVLMSEEIIDSDWSSEPLHPLAQSNAHNPSAVLQHHRSSANNDSETENSPSCLADSCEEVSSSQRPLFSDLDILDDEDLEEQHERVSPLPSCTSDYQHLNRSQLLEIIQEQGTRIQSLETMVERYRQAQLRLFEHVEALRLELNEINKIPSPLKRGKTHRGNAHTTISNKSLH